MGRAGAWGVSVGGPSVGGMFIDCGTCTARGNACADCVVTFLTIPVRVDAPPGAVVAAVRDGWEVQPSEGDATGIDLDDAERAAIAVLAGSGLVPPLRLVRAV